MDFSYANKSIWSEGNCDSNSSHVLPALLRKFHDSKISKSSEVTVWGSGKPLREFMHCDDLANALLFLLKNYTSYEHINVGSGVAVSIRELVDAIAEVVGYDAKIVWYISKPDGTPRKLMDTSNLHNLGWKDQRSLFDGISHTYERWLSELLTVIYCLSFWTLSSRIDIIISKNVVLTKVCTRLNFD